MISKELLSEVLGYTVTNISLLRGSHINITGNTEKYTPNTVSFNIHELAHKVKAWMNNVGYCPNTYWDTNGDIKCHDTYGLLPKPFIGETEPEAIFKAGQWILDNQ